MNEEVEETQDSVVKRLDSIILFPTEVDVSDDIYNIQVENGWFENFLGHHLFKDGERISSSLNYLEESIRGTNTEIFICGSNANNLRNKGHVNCSRDVDFWVVGRDYHPFELFKSEFLGERVSKSYTFDEDKKAMVETWLLPGTSIWVKFFYIANSPIPYDILIFHETQLIVDIYLTRLRKSESGIIRFGLGNKIEDVLIAKNSEDKMITEGGLMTLINVNGIYKKLIMSG